MRIGEHRWFRIYWEYMIPWCDAAGNLEVYVLVTGAIVVDQALQYAVPIGVRHWAVDANGSKTIS